MGGLTVTDGMIKLNEPVARVDDDQTQGQPDCSVAVLHGRVQQAGSLFQKKKTGRTRTASFAGT